jgi:ribosomal protein S2
MQNYAKNFKRFLNYYFYNINKSIFLFNKLLILIKKILIKNGDIVIITGSTFQPKNIKLLSKKFIVLQEWPSGVLSNYSTTKIRNFLYKSMLLDKASLSIKRRKTRVKTFYTKNKNLVNSNKIPSLVIYFLTKQDKKIPQELKKMGIPCVIITNISEEFLFSSNYIIKCNITDFIFQDFITSMLLKTSYQV